MSLRTMVVGTLLLAAVGAVHGETAGGLRVGADGVQVAAAGAIREIGPGR